MARVERSATLETPIDKAWAALSDVSRWAWTVRPRGSGAGSRPEIRLLEGSGVGARVGVLVGGSMHHIWQVTEWVPPTRLAAASVGSKSSWAPVKGSLSVALSPLAPGRTRADIRVEFTLGMPLIGAFLSDSPMLRKHLEEGLDAFLKELA